MWFTYISVQRSKNNLLVLFSKVLLDFKRVYNLKCNNFLTIWNSQPPCQYLFIFAWPPCQKPRLLVCFHKSWKRLHYCISAETQGVYVTTTLWLHLSLVIHNGFVGVRRERRTAAVRVTASHVHQREKKYPATIVWRGIKLRKFHTFKEKTLGHLSYAFSYFTQNFFYIVIGKHFAWHIKSYYLGQK